MVVVVPPAGILETCCCVGARWANREDEPCPRLASQDALLSSSIGIVSLVRCSWRGVHQQFFPFDKQQEHRAELQELYMLDDYAETLEARRLLALSCIALESGGWRRALLVRLDDRGDELGNDSELDVLLNSQFARLGWKIRIGCPRFDRWLERK
jgi:hypothetical protein